MVLGFVLYNRLFDHGCPSVASFILSFTSLSDEEMLVLLLVVVMVVAAMTVEVVSLVASFIILDICRRGDRRIDYII
jgi:hypothetical protein